MSSTDPTSVVADNPQFATVLSPTPAQSIHDLIWFLKSCCRDSDFDLIQQVLLSRENTLAQSNKELSNRIVNLELRHRSAVEELQRAVIGRAEAERKRGDEERRRRRIVEVIGKFKELEAEKRMAEGEVAKEEEIRRNGRLEKEKRKFEKEEEVRALVERNRRLEAEKGEFEKVRSEKEEEIRALVERNRRLEAEKMEFEKVRIGKEEIVREAEEKAKVEMELEAMRGFMDEVLRMMKEVKALMVAYTTAGENGHSGGGEKKVQDRGRPPVQKTIASDGKVDDRKGAMSLRKKLVFSPEVSQENSPPVAEKPTPSVPIILSDTDDEDDKMLIVK
ncbi:hypothetical protein AKJ16_DCAP00686 [Drosera capensis]